MAAWCTGRLRRQRRQFSVRLRLCCRNEKSARSSTFVDREHCRKKLKFVKCYDTRGVVSALRESWDHTVLPATPLRRRTRHDLSQLVWISCSRILHDEQEAAAMTQIPEISSSRPRAELATPNIKSFPCATAPLRACKDDVRCIPLAELRCFVSAGKVS